MKGNNIEAEEERMMREYPVDIGRHSTGTRKRRCLMVASFFLLNDTPALTGYSSLILNCFQFSVQIRKSPI